MDLYRFFSADGQLLYIGISLNAATRADDHRRHQPWWPDAVRMTVEHLGDVTRRDALQAERTAIAMERPLHNIIYAPRDHHVALKGRHVWHYPAPQLDDYWEKHRKQPCPRCGAPSGACCVTKSNQIFYSSHSIRSRRPQEPLL